MGTKASAHAVYDLKYHVVWAPKYRKAVLKGEVGEAAKAVLRQVAEAYGMEIETLEVAEDHVHIFVGAPQRYSPARIVQILKSISARELFSRSGWLR